MGSFRARRANMNHFDAGLHQRNSSSKAARLVDSNDAHAARVVVPRAAFRLPTNRMIWLLTGCLLGCDAAGRFNEALDSLLDVPERPEAGFDGRRGDILQNIGRDGVAQTVEIIDKLAAARGEKQAVGPPISGIA